jgi:hypothetical protein
MRKFVQGVLEIRSLKLGAIKAWSRGQGAGSDLSHYDYEQEQELEMIGG